MASLIYSSFIHDVLTGAINVGSDTFKVMLVTAAYTENKDTHTRRSDIIGEAIGVGYVAGGAAKTATVAAVDTANDDIEITIGSASWPSSTITARKAVVYKSRGGPGTADELVCVIDFATNVISVNGTFTLTASNIKFQN